MAAGAGPLPSRAPARPHPLPCGPSARPARPCQAARSATVSCVVSSKAPCPRGLSHAHTGSRPAPLLTGGSSHSAHTRVTRGRVSPSDTCSHACCSDFVCVAPPHTHTRCPSPVHIRAWFSASVRLHRTPTDRHAPSPSPGDPGTLASPALCPSPRQTIEFDGSAGAVLRIQPLRTPRDENVYECVAQNAAGEITVHAKLTVLRGTVVPGAGSGRGGRHRAPALGTHLRRHLPASGFGFSLWGALGRPSPARDAAGPGTCWQGLAAPWGKGEHGGTEVTPLFIFIVLFRF